MSEDAPNDSFVLRPLANERFSPFGTSLPRPKHKTEDDTVLLAAIVLRREDASLSEVVNAPPPRPRLVLASCLRLYTVIQDNYDLRHPFNEFDAATLIQASIRGWGVRRAMEMRFLAARRIQAVARGVIQRIDWAIANLARWERARENN